MYVLERLEANGGNPTRAAAELGIERTNLYRKLKQLGIALPGAVPRLADSIDLDRVVTPGRSSESAAPEYAR